MILPVRPAIRSLEGDWVPLGTAWRGEKRTESRARKPGSGLPCYLALKKLLPLSGFYTCWGLHILVFVHLTFADSMIPVKQRGSVPQCVWPWSSRKWGWQINDEVPRAQEKGGNSSGKVWSCGAWGGREHCTHSFGAHLAVFFGFTFGYIVLAPLQSPELLAEKMESQRKEHRPWAAAHCAAESV